MAKDRIEEILVGLYEAGITAHAQIPKKTGIGMVVAEPILLQEAKATINKEIERICLEVIGSDEPVISNLSPNKTSASYRNRLRTIQRTRLTQALSNHDDNLSAKGARKEDNV